MTRIFIINRDRLNSPKEMVQYLKQMPDAEPIIIDNASTNPELLAWYETQPCEIMRMPLNYCELVLFREDTGLIDKLHLKEGNYCVTDSDLDLSKVPLNVLDVLKEGLRRYPARDKVGLSLSLENLADTPIKADILQHEQHFWNHKADDQFYEAWVDTSFALYRSSIHSFNSLRTAPPYTAIHRPWHYTKETLPEDEIYYMKHSVQSHWTKKLKEYYGI